MYLTVVAKDYVILLNSVVSASGPETAIRKFLLDVMTSLKVSSEPIDVKKDKRRFAKATDRNSSPFVQNENEST